MTTRKGKSLKETWTPEKFEAFGREITAVGEEAKAKLGHEDVAYVKKVRKLSRASEAVGRALIHFSLDPFTWGAGVLALWVHHQLETIEIGHSALHGCWDGLAGAEAFFSSGFKWIMPTEEEAWKREHNILHHQYTNVVGKDPDLNYGGLRIADQTRWWPHNLIQYLQFFITAPVFTYTIAVHATGLTDLAHPAGDETYANVLPDKKLKTVWKAFRQTAKKLVPYSAYHFGLWPVLAGPMWWKVLLGNLSADALRNIYTIATIYAGHFGDDLEYFDKDFKASGRGEWYKAQIEAAHDYAVPGPVSLLCGALDYQIEHHLFPKLPPNRLRKIAPKIQEICERYGVRYHRTDWGKTLKGSLKRILKMSVPSFPLRTANQPS
ncbi:MAG TPA: fatty acid desaturase [bacterium]|nr:fatty acid desaturase [bacterium]